MFWLRFGGFYREVRKNNGSGEKRNYYCWQVVSKEAESFLRVIGPYLVSKKMQALVGLELRERINKNEHPKRGHPMSEEEFSYREQLRKLIKALKGRI